MNVNNHSLEAEFLFSISDVWRTMGTFFLGSRSTNTFLRGINLTLTLMYFRFERETTLLIYIEIVFPR